LTSRYNIEIAGDDPACAHFHAYAQEAYIKDEMRNLKRELIRAKEVTL